MSAPEAAAIPHRPVGPGGGSGGKGRAGRAGRSAIEAGTGTRYLEGLMVKGALRSMTGYGAAEREAAGGRVRVEIRSVNHRFLNLQIRVAPGMERYQDQVEGQIRGRMARGHVAVSLGFDRDSGGAIGPPPIQIDMERAKAYRDALRAAQVELGLDGGVDLRLLAGFRDLFHVPDGERTAPEIEARIVGDAVGEAVARAVEMREAEGERLGRDLAGRLDGMEQAIVAIEARAPERLVRERDRLRVAVRELLEDGRSADEDRIAREIAHLAERWDIHEEIVRFRSHLAMFRETLAAGGAEGVGKRLGFVTQELLRETNTIGSKANDVEIAQRVVAVKEEIERIREQIENLE